MGHHIQVIRIVSRILFLWGLWTSAIAAESPLLVVTENSPPNQTLENNQVAGLATDKVRKIIQAAGLTAEFRMYPWARSYELAMTRPDTLIYSMASSPKRDLDFVWIAPVAHFRLALMTLESRTVTGDPMQELRQHRFAVQRNDIAHEWIKKQGLVENEHFLVCPDIICSWDLLIKGNIDLVVDDPLLAQGALDELGISGVKAKVVAPIPELEFVGYLAIHKNSDARLQQALIAAAKKLGLTE